MDKLTTAASFAAGVITLAELHAEAVACENDRPENEDQDSDETGSGRA